MKLTEALVLYDIRKLLISNDRINDPTEYVRLLKATTHMYFSGQSVHITNDFELDLLCNRLRDCSDLTSINFSFCKFSNWHKVFQALTGLHKLEVINIRGCDTTTFEAYKSLSRASEIEIITDSSPPFMFPEHLKLKDKNKYTASELKDFLLLAYTVHIKTHANKLSRKRFTDVKLPFSIIMANNEPMILLKAIVPDFMLHFNESCKKNNEQKRVGFVIGLSSADLQLKIMLVKIKSVKHELYASLAFAEVIDLRHHTEASFLRRANKVYTMQPFIAGAPLSKFIDKDAFKPFDAAKTDLYILRSMSVILAVLLMHVTGRIHRDIKPTNIILRDNNLADLIDKESVVFCPPGAQDESTNKMYTTTYYPPQSYTNKPSMYTEGFALVKTLEQVLIPQGLFWDKNYQCEADENDEFYIYLKEHYSREVKNWYGEDMSTLFKNILDTPHDLPTLDLFNFFDKKYPGLKNTVLQAKYKFLCAEILEIFAKYPKIKIWLYNFTPNNNALFLQNIRSSLETSKSPINPSLDDIIFAELVRHTLHIFVAYNSQPSSIATATAIQVLNDACSFYSLDIHNSWPLFRKIHQTIDIVHTIQNELSEIILRMAFDLMNKHFLEMHSPIIAHLMQIHRQIIAHLTNHVPVQNILGTINTSLHTLCRNHNNPHLSKAVNEVSEKLFSRFAELGDSFQQITSSNNPLFNDPRILVENVPTLYSDRELFHKLPFIANDKMDSANLGSLLTRYAKNPSATGRLITAGAKNIIMAIESSKFYLVKRMLENDCKPCKEVGGKIPLRVAAANATTIAGIQILEMLLQHTTLEDKEIVWSVTLGITSNPANLNHEAIRLLMRFIIKNEAQFAQQLQSLVVNIIKSSQKELLLIVVHSGFSILEDLPDYDEPSKYFFRYFTCLQEKPYDFFIECKNNILTKYMRDRDYAFVESLLHADITNLDQYQLGFHLIVAARDKQFTVTQTLLDREANRTIKYPCGWYQGWDIYNFGEKYDFRLPLLQQQSYIPELVA